MILQIFFIGLLLVVPLSVSAASPVALYRIGSQVTVSGSGDAHVVGRSVRAENLQGDLMAVGRDVTVEGFLRGDLATLSRTLAIRGQLTDDVRVVAERLEITGDIRGHLLAAARTVDIGPTAQIGDVSTVVGQTVNMRGRFESLVYILGDSVTLAGTYDGDVVVIARSAFTVHPGTIIRGMLRFSVRPGAVVRIPETVPSQGKFVSSEEWARFFLRVPLPRIRLSPFLSLWVLGALFIFLRPRDALRLQGAIRAWPLSDVVRGFLGFLAVGALILVTFLSFFLLSVLLVLALLLVLAAALGLGPIALAGIVPAEDWQSLLMRYSAASFLLFLGFSLFPLSVLAFSSVLSLCVAGAGLQLIVSDGRSGSRA
ncbi:hypothetical protein HY464_00800 [Candidatus Peregrinibacteria bacterium]|nr:hypothetical protein [Candidatus Peregrinibacteria bacterium]